MNQKLKLTLSVIGICLLIAIIFYAPQGIFSVMVTTLLSFYYGLQGISNPDAITEHLMVDLPQYLGYILILSSIIVVIILVVLKFVNLKKGFSAGKIQWRLVPAIIVAAIAGIFASDLINEWFDFEDMLGAQLADMARNIPGMLAIAVIGPIAEEIAFRGALINKLREKGLGPWATILISAFVFGAIHGNPIQIPFAMMVGVILGIIYVKTESLILCCVCHVLNNSFAVVMMNIYGDSEKDMTWSDVLGGSTNVGITLILCLIASISFFYWYWKKA